MGKVALACQGLCSEKHGGERCTGPCIVVAIMLVVAMLATGCAGVGVPLEGRLQDGLVTDVGRVNDHL